MKSTREALGEVLLEYVNDPRVVVLDADTSSSTRSVEFARACPERFFNVGCAEQNLIATAAGFAYAGKIAIACGYVIFVTGRAWEQIRNFVAHDNLNVKIFATHCGFTNAPDGSSHHSLEDIAALRVIPRMVIIVPADYEEAKQAMRAAIEYPGPCYVRLSRIASPQIFSTDYRFILGKAVVLREGKDVAIIANGNMLYRALLAAEQLKQEGISAGVVNFPTIKPADEEAVLKVARESGAIVTAEEHSIHGGLGSLVAEIVSSSYPVPMEMIGVRDTFGQSGEPEELYLAYGLTAEKIIEACRRVVKRK
jgi:transketolase